MVRFVSSSVGPVGRQDCTDLDASKAALSQKRMLASGSARSHHCGRNIQPRVERQRRPNTQVQP